MRKVSVCLLLCASSHAQSTVVSPGYFAAREGNAAHELLGWRDEYRYQQSHGDLGASAFAIKSLALRRDGAQADSPSSAARTIDAELVMCDGPGAAFSVYFASNYASPPQVVVARKAIALPDLRKPAGVPAAFSAVIAFDVPFAHAFGKDVLWELRMFGSTATGAYLCDAYDDNGVYELPGRNYGTSCTLVGPASPVSASAILRTESASLQHSAEWKVPNLKTSLPGWSYWVLGAAPAFIQVPGWCAPVLVQPDVLVVTTGYNSSGFKVGPLPFTPALIGAPVYAQAYVGASGYGLVLSDAVVGAIPEPLPGGLPVRHLFAQALAPTLGFGQEKVGGVIVQFGY